MYLFETISIIKISPSFVSHSYFAQTDNNLPTPFILRNAKFNQDETSS